VWDVPQVGIQCMQIGLRGILPSTLYLGSSYLLENQGSLVACILIHTAYLHFWSKVCNFFFWNTHNFVIQNYYFYFWMPILNNKQQTLTENCGQNFVKFVNFSFKIIHQLSIFPMWALWMRQLLCHFFQGKRRVL
jgi:hypothetical protein